MTFEQRTRLNKLNSLRDQGLLTDAAFEEAKDEVLNMEVKGVRRFADVIVLFLAIAIVLGILITAYLLYQHYWDNSKNTGQYPSSYRLSTGPSYYLIRRNSISSYVVPN